MSSAVAPWVLLKSSIMFPQVNELAGWQVVAEA
jgi:hypothetical protein